MFPKLTDAFPNTQNTVKIILTHSTNIYGFFFAKKSSNIFLMIYKTHKFDIIQMELLQKYRNDTSNPDIHYMPERAPCFYISALHFHITPSFLHNFSNFP